MNTGTKKKAAILFSTALLASIMAGCGGNNGNNEPAASNDGSPAAEASSGPVETLTVEVFDRGIQGQPDLNNNTWTKYVNEKFGKPNNAVVKFVTVPRSQEVDKLNVLMAANEAPDISFTYDGTTVTRFAKNNGLYTLDELLEKHGQQLKSYLGDTVLDYGKYEGKQVSIPAKRTLLAWSGLFIRKDWLDKLGLPVPTNKDELYDTLVAFRDKNPGNVTGVIPWGTAAAGMNYSFGNLVPSFWGPMSEEEFVTTTNWLKPGNKDAYKWLNKLYSEKLISPDFALDKTAKQADADVTNGKVGFYGANWDYPLTAKMREPLKQNAPDANYVPIDVFKNAEGKYIKETYNENGLFSFIPKSSKHAELAMKYLNWMADPEVLFFLQFGEEGVNHTMVDGIPQGIAQTGENMQMSNLNLDYTLIVNGAELGDTEKNVKTYAAALATGDKDYEKMAIDSYRINTTDGYTGFYYGVPNEASIKYGKTLGDMNKQMMDRLIVAKPAEFDALYDKLVKEYMDAGGKAVQEENVKHYREIKESGK
ncbi:extracellular solute-binding protein [Paenibacillus glycanilyticus]|uniref:extracellular solute-binding protein n=1 Tax=Paenibacillus glycanilyticus TaxID=126569 RepID=UPI00203FBEC5|nr:extracellular solute-binding protein [Paenibacillus glycanilyticus]MCM3628705.1 extracellular solute-binding protein [Paenibacillus glycanilyticus]